MYPMLAAVHRFLPVEVVLCFRRRSGAYAVSITAAVTQIVGVEKKGYISCPVAILVDGKTMSAAEMVLLSFRGLDGVRSFGSRTGGYTSANSSFELPKNTLMALTTAATVTRTGEEFCNDPVDPDVKTATPLDAAIQWINNQ